VIELLKVIRPLTDPTAHGGRVEDAFDVVLPSLPGYGFSGVPKEVGWDPGRTAQAWAELMKRLGYNRYVAQGAAVTDYMAIQAPQGVTRTGASAARIYWEGTRAAARAAGQTLPEVSLPVAFTVFPDEIFKAPRSWAERVYPNLIYLNEVDRGGHFAAREPALFATELRAAFRSLR
jgi:pimeloyl-ACP methyl ester carboxylesterase